MNDMDTTKNIVSLPLCDTTANGGKWRSVTEGDRRSIYHYGTLMAVIRLDADGYPAKLDDDPSVAYRLVYEYERPGGSQSDKCGLSRIGSAILRHWTTA